MDLARPIVVCTCLVLTSLPGFAGGNKSNTDAELRRRAMFGAQLAPVTDDIRNRQMLDGNGGIVLEKIFPNTSAAFGDLKAGDVVLAIGGAKIENVAMFFKRMENSRAGDVLALAIVRDGTRLEKRVTLKEMPREKGDGYEVIYGAVSSRGARLRTIATRPKGVGRHPAVLLLQGSGCWSIDNPVGPPTGFTWIAQGLTRRGYVTMRVDRPGCGDSEGGPCRDVDFETELAGYKQALKALRQFDFVDADNIFLYGHSQGGVVAPLIALEAPVRGIAVFGTASATWFESVFGQRRRLASLDGTKAVEVDREMIDQARFWYPLLVEKKTPREIRERHPEARKALDQWVKEEKYVGERHFLFHHQVADLNLADAWTKVAAARPRVLALWGTTDWLSTREANAWIAEVVNRATPGIASFAELPKIDHFFFHSASAEESYRIWKGAPAKGFNPVILDRLDTWLAQSRSKANKQDGS